MIEWLAASRPLCREPAGDSSRIFEGNKTFNIQHSTFNIQHSTFNIQHSTFNIQHSTFNIQHSTFNAQIRRRARSEAAWAFKAGSGYLVFGCMAIFHTRSIKGVCKN
jgi:hypothetical protein